MNPLLLSGIFSVGEKLINRFFPDPALAAAAKLELIKMEQSGDLAMMANETSLALAQIGVNAKEAEHSSLFVSSWRPAAAWMCVFALGYSAIIEPIMRFAATLYGYSGAFPAIDTDITLQILMGLLGLAGARSWDKSKGTAK